MNLRQQIVQSNIESVSNKLKVSSDEAFLRFGHSLLTDESVHSFDNDDLVDGGQDKQIDVISIYEEGDEAYVYIIQSKYTKSFESNIIIQMKNGLNWVFNKNRNDIKGLDNKKFKDRILKYREVQNSIGPSNLHVKVYYITNAAGTDVSKECLQEIETIEHEYDNDVFSSFNFELISSNEIVDIVNSADKGNKKIDNDIKIKYDANTPSLIKYQTEGMTGIICTVPASEIARIVNEDKNGYIFDMNIRKYLGNRGGVNQDILTTCSNTDESYKFWFLNNGVTIVCDTVDPVTDPDNPHIKIKNMQIVNGCQTSSSLAKAAEDGSLKKDTKVLLRIYQTGNDDLISKIVLTTNNQNKISGRNLRSNDFIQTDLQEGFKLYELFYERKPREFDEIDGSNKSNIFPNDVVASAYLAICLCRCGDSRSRKYKVWNEFYQSIFNGNIPIEPYVYSALLYNKIKEELSSIRYSGNDDVKLRYISKNASFHVSRIASFLALKTNSWKDTDLIKGEIKRIRKNDFDIQGLTQKSFDVLINVLNLEKDLNNTLKSSLLDSEISKYLNEKANNTP
jgi:hypothetical protein